MLGALQQGGGQAGLTGMVRGDKVHTAATFTATTKGAEQMFAPGSGAALGDGAAVHGAVKGGGSVVHLPAAQPGAPLAVTGAQAQLGPHHESLQCQ